MNLLISDKVLSIFPDLAIALVYGQIDKPKPDLDRKIADMKVRALKSLAAKFPQVEDLAKDKRITAWREAYGKFGVKAKEHKPTHEALARRLLKQGSFITINPIVDIYLSNQIEHLLPHGGYDLSCLDGDSILDVSEQGECFEPLGGGEEMTLPGELIYRDGSRVLTRRWNHRDCDATKLTEETKSFVLLIESPSKEITIDQLREAGEDLVGRYQECFQGSFSLSLQSKGKLEACAVPS